MGVNLRGREKASLIESARSAKVCNPRNREPPDDVVARDGGVWVPVPVRQNMQHKNLHKKDEGGVNASLQVTVFWCS